MQKYGTGSALQQGIQAATAAVQGLAGGDLAKAIAGGSAPYIAEVIHNATTDPASGKVNTEANLMAHAVLGAVVSQINGSGALAGAAGATTGEYIAQQLYPDVARDKLTEAQRQTISALGTLAAGLAGGIAGGDTAGAVAGAQAGKNAVENNYLSTAQQAQKDKEIADCQTLACKASAQAKWTAIDLGQDGSFAAGMVAGVPAGLYDTIDSIVKTASNPQETYEALKSLFNSGDVLGNVSDAVKQSYIDRIDRMEAEYQKAGASGSYNAGVEGGKLVTDLAGLLAGSAGVVKGGAVLTEKVVAKVGSKAESAAANAGKATSGAENAATYPKLKDDLVQQNLNNIAKQDPRLDAVVKGDNGKLNYGVGSGSKAEADRLGQIWIGDGAKLVTNQKDCPGCLVSADGFRIYRPPSEKPNAPAHLNPTGTQANFVQQKDGKITGNAHMSIEK